MAKKGAPHCPYHVIIALSLYLRAGTYNLLTNCQFVVLDGVCTNMTTEKPWDFLLLLRFPVDLIKLTLFLPNKHFTTWRRYELYGPPKTLIIEIYQITGIDRQGAMGLITRCQYKRKKFLAVDNGDTNIYLFLKESSKLMMD